MGQDGLMRQLRRFRLSLSLAAITLIGLFCFADPAKANSIYGHDDYGICYYEVCTTTVVTTPSGLEVAINLADDQVIPYTGYTVTITPLNGAGNTFKEARIYLEGVLVATVLPDSTGTASWIWDPSVQSGTHITIDVVDTTGNITTHSFTIRIGSASPAPTTDSNPQNAPTGGTTRDTTPTDANPLTAIPKQVYEKLKEAIRDLPAPVAEAFPYFLFILLAINLLILLLHLYREVREKRIFQRLLNRARLLAEQKQVFNSLVSHYLRTPATILSGSMDLMKMNGASKAVINGLDAIIGRIRTKIDMLLEKTRLIDVQPSLSRKLIETPHFWRQFNLFLPIVLIGFVLFVFNIVAIDVGKFSHPQVQVIVQVLIFSILVLITYQIFRRHYLQVQDRALAQQLVKQAAAMAQTHDNLMSQAVQDLSDDAQALETAKATLPLEAPNEYISQGIKRLQTVLTQFTTAMQLKGIHSGQAAKQMKLSQLIKQIRPDLEANLAKYQVTLSLGNDLNLSVPDIALLSHALRDVLDNAIAFSHPLGTVYVEAAQTPGGSHIIVRDDGNGVPAQKLALIFQPLYKAEGATTANHEGMGFSLYLDKLIMTYLGGDITLNSEPGHGTRVTLQLQSKFAH